MKTKIFSLLTAVPTALLLLSFAASKPKEVIELNSIDNSMAKVNDKLYACKYEVTNFLYRTFENDLKLNKRTDDLKTACVDTLNWRDNKCYNEPFVEYYYRHVAYDNYPVVNISYDAANLFCKWLTEKYNSNPKRKFKKVIFRLPDEQEWETAAAGGCTLSPYPWGGPYMQNKKGEFLCNFIHIGDQCVVRDSVTGNPILSFGDAMGIAGSLNDAADITAPVKAYWPNNFGLYNMSGNVAEMISEKGRAKGGSWRSFGGDVNIKAVAHYKKSASTIGFRYFMEVVEK